MDIVIANDSDKPIYKQIYEQLSTQIINGSLKSDECLPAIRTVASELRISVITVKKAWEELEKNGFIYTMVGKGCFVAAMHTNQLKQKQSDMALEKLKEDISYCKSLGLSLEQLQSLVKDNY